jgi:hypothetical protein
MTGWWIAVSRKPGAHRKVNTPAKNMEKIEHWGDFVRKVIHGISPILFTAISLLPVNSLLFADD